MSVIRNWLELKIRIYVLFCWTPILFIELLKELSGISKVNNLRDLLSVFNAYKLCNWRVLQLLLVIYSTVHVIDAFANFKWEFVTESYIVNKSVRKIAFYFGMNNEKTSLLRVIRNHVTLEKTSIKYKQIHNRNQSVIAPWNNQNILPSLIKKCVIVVGSRRHRFNWKVANGHFRKNIEQQLFQISIQLFLYQQSETKPSHLHMSLDSNDRKTECHLCCIFSHRLMYIHIYNKYRTPVSISYFLIGSMSSLFTKTKKEIKYNLV